MSESKLIAASLDLLNEGFGVFDTDLKLAACNRGFAELNQYPEELCRPALRCRQSFASGPSAAILVRAMRTLR